MEELRYLHPGGAGAQGVGLLTRSGHFFAGPTARELYTRETSEVLIRDSEQLVCRAGVALPPGVEKLFDVAGHWSSISHTSRAPRAMHARMTSIVGQASPLTLTHAARMSQGRKSLPPTFIAFRGLKAQAQPVAKVVHTGEPRHKAR
jgi:hypothetical protein